MRFLRTLANLTQAELAERLDLTVEHISNIERGKTAPSFKTLSALAGALNTEPANLFLFPDPDAPPQNPWMPPPAAAVPPTLC